MDVSPLWRFAPWTFRPQSWSFCPLDGSPPGRFAPWTIRHLDDLTTCDGRFTPPNSINHWKQSDKVFFLNLMAVKWFNQWKHDVKKL